MNRPSRGLRIVAALAAPALLLTALTAVAAVPSSAQAGPAASSRQAFPSRFELPDGFQPEGIAISRGVAYFGSRLDGDIYAADLRTGAGTVISQGPGTGSLGMKVDQRGRLFVAGAAGGDGRVVDTRTGNVLASYTFATTTPTFVNDVILTKNAAWFTDSNQPVLYKLPLGRKGQLPGQSAVQTVPLTGDYEHNPTGFNLNGIARTPDGRGLLVVQSSRGLLFRVDPKTGATRTVDLGGALLTNGDGLLVIGRTLYVVQNRSNKVGVFTLDSAGTRGSLVREITSPDFDVPTTAAAFGDRLYLPNARFNTSPTPATEYWVTAVRR